MLHNIDFSSKDRQTRFFRAQMRDEVIAINSGRGKSMILQRPAEHYDKLVASGAVKDCRDA